MAAAVAFKSIKYSSTNRSCLGVSFATAITCRRKLMYEGKCPRQHRQGHLVFAPPGDRPRGIFRQHGRPPIGECSGGESASDQIPGEVVAGTGLEPATSGV